MARHARRAVIASTIGTMIEWYDFYLYGLVAAIVFGKLYFPSHDPYSATLLAFSTFFLGFVARPIGAMIFGHFGDRIGRKGTLVATLLLMGGSTVLIGLVPTYESIGIWGAIALTLLRVLQGIGVGGEWGGAIAVATEWSRFDKRRGLAASWPQFGSPLGMLLAVAALTLTSYAGSTEWFETVGWRIPFLFSALLIVIGLYIRLGVLETPVFRNMQEKKEIASTPVLEAVRGYWREIVLTCLIRTGQQAPFVLFTTFLLAYGTKNLGLDRSYLFNIVLVAAALSLFTTPFFGHLSDRIGRKRMYLIGAFAMMAFAFPYFWMLDSKIPFLVVLAILMSLPIHDMQYAPQAAFIAESFPPSVRYSGSSIGYQLASITSGGPAPMIAAYLLHTYGTSTAISVYIAVIAAISFVSACFLRDRSRDDYSTNEGWVRDDRTAVSATIVSPST
ncbi:MHS family MFS transporter [Ancylobacter sp. MQZ15Z-1]|uniref:MHS family MFS transporter n=1 Tax=Ancylobacter mangrovi TaxID=2972472 RepID=A0A9X2T1J8_9HYPH|nr:MFS transporter [Ancylobacter mangrovi]MCS0494767.1 MHS family MFS transporter [Ancylobacter mangrovi]